MLTYKLSPLAEDDLRNIFEFGIDRFGVQQAVEYLEGLERHFDRLVENPYLYPSVDHIREGYRRKVCGVHAIYYRISGDAIEIMRILYMEDVGAAF